MAYILSKVVSASTAPALNDLLTASFGQGFTLNGPTQASGGMLVQPLIWQYGGSENRAIPAYNPERLSRNYRMNVTASNLFTTASTSWYI